MPILSENGGLQIWIGMSISSSQGPDSDPATSQPHWSSFTSALGMRGSLGHNYFRSSRWLPLLDASLVDFVASQSHINGVAEEGVQPCVFYLQNGHCKFGSTCKFDHPLGSVRYSPSASSLTDMPVTPYPVGSLLSTLAPSTTSSELRPELESGAKVESFASRMPSSGNGSSNSVSLIFSQGGTVSLSDVQLSSQTATPSLSSSRSTRQSGDIR